MMPLKPSSEEVIERWMLAIVADGGITRFDDLHIDEIDEQWKDRNVWVGAGLEAYRIAVALRNRHQLPFVVALGFSLETGPASLGMDFHTPAELSKRLDWSTISVSVSSGTRLLVPALKWPATKTRQVIVALSNI